MYGDKVEIHFVKGLEYSRDKNKMNFNKVLAKASQVDVIIAFIGEEAILSGEAHCLADIKATRSTIRTYQNIKRNK